VLGARLGLALRAGLGASNIEGPLVEGTVVALERTRLFEATMASLLHLRLPGSNLLDGLSVAAVPIEEPASGRVGRVRPMTDGLDVDAMIERFRERAKAVRSRGVPPIEGAERKRFIEQAKLDYMDYAMLGDATAAVEDGVLTLRIDLRPTS
jgi:hypothetical protein